MDLPNVDWGVFRKYPKQTIKCICGSIYRSYAKSIVYQNRFTIITEDACPCCNQVIDHVLRASSDPEVEILDSESIGNFDPFS